MTTKAQKKTQLGWSCAKSTPKEEGGGDTGWRYRSELNLSFSFALLPHTLQIMATDIVQRKNFNQRQAQKFLYVDNLFLSQETLGIIGFFNEYSFYALVQDFFNAWAMSRAAASTS